MSLHRTVSTMSEMQYRGWLADERANVSRRKYSSELTTTLLQDAIPVLSSERESNSRQVVVLGLDDGGLAMIETALPSLVGLDVRYMGSIPRTIEYLTSCVTPPEGDQASPVALLMAHRVRDVGQLLDATQALTEGLHIELFGIFIAVDTSVIEAIGTSSILNGRFIGEASRTAHNV